MITSTINKLDKLRTEKHTTVCNLQTRVHLSQGESEGIEISKIKQLSELITQKRWLAIFQPSPDSASMIKKSQIKYNSEENLDHINALAPPGQNPQSPTMQTESATVQTCGQQKNNPSSASTTASMPKNVFFKQNFYRKRR